MGTRTYIIDNEKMEFDVQRFRRKFDELKNSEKITGLELKERISIKLQVAPDTVHGWLYGKNSPSGIEYINELATALGLKDYTILLRKYNGGKNMNNLTDRQLSAVKRIYDICIWFLDEFDHTSGFNDFWYKFKEQGYENPEETIYEYVEGLMRKVNLILEQEYFDLRNCEIYNELCEYVSEDLTNTYDGKLSYAYRFEAIPDENPTTMEDYDKAMTRLNCIIEKYVG